MKFVKVCFILLYCVGNAHGFIDGLYCGLENCYELLDVNYESTKSEITKAYRKLARKWHPDMHKKEKDKEAASLMFQKIANAYDVLKDEESRNDYNYMLDHPEEYYHHYYRYYAHRVAPKVDVRIVIVVTISLISLVQYWSAWNNYNDALRYLVQHPKYRLQATNIAKQKGLLNDKKKRDRTKTKDEIREEEEKILKDVIAEKMDIKGSYEKPSITDILWIQMFMFPYYVVMYIVWFIRWIWKFWILKEPYGEEEKLHMIRKNFGLSQGKFNALEDHEKDQFLKLELWIKDKFQVYKQDKEIEEKAKLAESGRYKMMRRYMKKGGPGQISFGPE